MFIFTKQLKTNHMKSTILKVEYEFSSQLYNNEFILFEGDTLENLLPTDAKVISIKCIAIIK